MKPFPYLIRPMTAMDIPAVLGVERMVFLSPWPDTLYFQELYERPNSRYFVLQLRDRPLSEFSLLGFVGLRVHQKQGHLSTLAVHPKWQRRGLGEWLLLTALEQAVSDSCSDVVLEVRVENVAAQSLYAKYGFRVTSLMQKYYYRDNGDAYLMRVLLSPSYVTFLQQQRAAWRERWYPQAPTSPAASQDYTFSVQEAAWTNENEN